MFRRSMHGVDVRNHPSIVSIVAAAWGRSTCHLLDLHARHGDHHACDLGVGPSAHVERRVEEMDDAFMDMYLTNNIAPEQIIALETTKKIRTQYAESSDLGGRPFCITRGATCLRSVTPPSWTSCFVSTLKMRLVQLRDPPKGPNQVRRFSTRR